MVFVTNPNLPENLVSLVVVDERINAEAESTLNGLGTKILKLHPHRMLYKAVCSHPDMLLHHASGDTVIFAPGTDPILLNELDAYGFKMLEGETKLSSSYPGDIAYNVARVGSKYFHNLRYTDPLVRRLLEKNGIEPIHVEQGYSKCSVLPIDENSLITSDVGIAKAAEGNGFEVLLVDGERAIQLPGLNYGFIGGAACMLGDSVCVFNGDLKKLSCYKTLSAFLYKKNIRIKCLSDEYVTDIGSILPLMMIR